MKNSMIAILFGLVATSAQADGFVCESNELTVKVYNKTEAAEGVRNAAVMILSDPSVSSGRKTIARFRADNRRVVSSGATYVALVDLRYSDSERKGENVAGTKLGQIATITLDVDFNYSLPLEDGDVVNGALKISKRDGSQITLNMDCTRYLKN